MNAQERWDPPFSLPTLRGLQRAKLNYSFAKDDVVVEEHTFEGKLSWSYFLCPFFFNSSAKKRLHIIASTANLHYYLLILVHQPSVLWAMELGRWRNDFKKKYPTSDCRYWI